jgi:LuxR family transcriptional regulator, maltose regulon positive regulatory protein
VSQVPLTTDPLVSTKLRPSQARPKLVARPRLIAELEREAGRKLTLISAPAGFGKTTLLVEWLKGRANGDQSVAWVSLDEGDNDPVRFLSYLVAALRRTVGEGFGEGILAALRSPEPPRMEAVLGAFVNELADLPGEVAVVLDDFHVIDSESVHWIVSFLLERLPEDAHIVISGRVDPPLPLARLRARGQMSELHAADLRFTPEEAAAFLSDVMGLNLSAGDVTALERATEGWIAALQLAALSMRERKDVSGFIRSFSGSHRDVFDFLAEEVLQRQTDRVQTFLLETSILERLSGPLCDALTGRNDGQRTLERLERENLLVVPLDDDRVWYRYHHLFTDFLRGRLERESPERTVELHLCASEWYEENALVAEAVDHALSAGDHERASRLMESSVGQTWYRGEVMTLLGWLRKMPKEAMLRRPLLLVWYAAALMLVGRYDGVESLLREAEGAVGGAGEGDGEEPPGADEADPQHVLATAAAVRSLHARLQGDPQGAIEHARRALALLPADNLDPRPFAALCLAEAYRAADDLEAASATFAETAELGRAAGHDYIALTAMGSLAHLRIAQGRLREAEGSLRQALGFAAERGAELLPAVGRVRITMGELLLERDDLEASESELTLGTELAERAGELEVLVRGQVALSRVKWARGDAEGALKLAHKAERLARESGAPQAIADAAFWKARLHLMRNELRAAASELERASDVDDVPNATQDAERISLARLLVAREDHDEALQLLDRLREAAEAADRRGNVVEILTLQALALRAREEKSRALDEVGRALALAEPEGYVRHFVDEVPPMAGLLSEVLEAQQRGRLDSSRRVPAHYLRKLLAALERDATGTARPATELPEALSERELEVLQLIAAGKSNRRIASELFVSVGTVKTHVNNLYRKLDAHSRTQAVAQARELKLL